MGSFRFDRNFNSKLQTELADTKKTKKNIEERFVKIYKQFTYKVSSISNLKPRLEPLGPNTPTKYDYVAPITISIKMVQPVNSSES